MMGVVGSGEWVMGSGEWVVGSGRQLWIRGQRCHPRKDVDFLRKVNDVTIPKG